MESRFRAKSSHTPKVPTLDLKKKNDSRSRSYSQSSSPVEENSFQDTDKNRKLYSGKKPALSRSLVNSAEKLDIPKKNRKDSTEKSDTLSSPTSVSSSDSSADSYRADSNRSSSPSHRHNTVSVSNFFSGSHNKLVRSNQSLALTSVKRYSSESLLLERTLTHRYLQSIPQDILKTYYRMSVDAYETVAGSEDGFMYKEFLPQRNSPSAETFLFKNNKVIDCYLLDRNITLGDKGKIQKIGLRENEGEGGIVYIVYKFPGSIDKVQDIHANMRASIFAVKATKLKLNSYEEAIAIANLKLSDLYIDHCRAKNESQPDRTWFFMKYINGPNLLNLVYKKNSAQPTDSDESIVGRRYLKPELKINLLIELLQNYISKFYENNLMHVDLKTENVMVDLTKDMTPITRIIDVDKATTTNTVITRPTGTPGYIAWEITTCTKFPGRYTLESDLCELGIIGAELLSSYNYQSSIHRMQLVKEFNNQPTDEFSYQEVSSMMPDVFENELLTDIFAKRKILKTWLSLPIQKLYSFISDSFADFLPEDIALLKESTTDIINEIVYRLYIFPVLVKIILQLTHENPKFRPNKLALKSMLNEMRELKLIYKELTNKHNVRYSTLQSHSEGIPTLDELSFPTIPLLTRAEIMTATNNEVSNEHTPESTNENIKLSGFSSTI